MSWNRIFCSQRRAIAPRTAVITTPKVLMLIFEAMVPEWGVAVAVAVLEGKALRPVTGTPPFAHELLYSDQKEKREKKFKPKTFNQ